MPLSLAVIDLTRAAAPDSAAFLTSHWTAPVALAAFVLAYLVVMAEEKLHIRKSLPVMVAAGLLWVLVAIGFGAAGRGAEVEGLIRHNILEFAELFLFLLSAMTFVNTMEERGVFEALRNWLIGRGLTLRTLFWVTGALAFVISPVADNLTTALVMGAVVMAVGAGKPRFISLACINIVVAANAGGAFSPFGDITTLMVWQKGVVSFFEFFALFVPSLINWLVPAGIMALAVEQGKPEVEGERVLMKSGALTVVALLIGTIALAVSLHNAFHLPPVLGMMTGLGVLNVYAYWLKRRLSRLSRVQEGGPKGGTVVREGLAATVSVSGKAERAIAEDGQAVEKAIEPPIDELPEPDEIFADSYFQRPEPVEEATRAEIAAAEGAGPGSAPAGELGMAPTAGDTGPPTGALPRLEAIRHPSRFRLVPGRVRRAEPMDVLRTMERTEWDTLMFFYGVILCVGALGAFGYLAGLSRWLYGDLGPTWANILVGIVSAVIDNIPIMFAVLSMNPDMAHGQWLLVTLTAGVGGSLLSVGSAAGVALMGQARGAYTFLGHLKWTWAVALGYAASILAHLVLNRAYF